MKLRLVPTRQQWELQILADEGNIGPQPEGCATVTARELVVHHPFGPQAEYFRHGWASWSATSWWHVDREPWRVWRNPERTATAEDAATDRDDIHQSYLVTALTSPNCPTLLIGALGVRTALFDISDDVVRGRPLETIGDAGAAIDWFVMVGEETECWEAYARALNESLPVNYLPTPRREPGPAWSSWYSWYEEITDAIISREIPAAAAAGFRVFQLDDGWEKTVGHWEANSDFPRGMAAVARDIRSAGMTPGLWLAPFIAVASAPVVAEHPEYFIHDKKGELKPAGYNWGQAYYGMDCTHPGAQQWLRDLLRKYQAAGFEYFKLDFLNAAAIEGVRRENMSRESAYRLGIEVLRQAAPSAYLMGSGAVIAPSLGVMDGIRVGPDTAPYWDNTDRYKDPTGPGLRNALRNSVARSWLREVIDPDPDVAYVRTHGSLLSPEANAISIDIARVCGVFSTSDPAEWLTGAQRELLAGVCREFSGPCPQVKHTGRYTYAIGERLVDFEPWINPAGRMSDRLLIK